MNWARLCHQEFHQQTIEEKNLGISVTQFLVYKDEPGFYASQKYFAGSLVLPLFQAIQVLFPELTMAERIKANLQTIDEKTKALSETPQN